MLGPSLQLLSNLQFEWPWALWFLPLPLLLAFLPRVKNSQAALRLPSHMPWQAQLGPANKSAGAWLRRIIAVLIWLLLVLAAMRPQWQGDAIELPTSGRDLMLAVDISGSMEERDSGSSQTPMTRLQAVQSVASDFIKEREGDRVGLLLFAERAYIQAPLSLDGDTVAMLLRDASVGLAGQSTAVGDAIGLALKKLRESEDDQRQRVLILLTDGASNAGALSVSKAVELAQTEGLKIHTIGFGGFKQRLPADVDERTMRYIANKTGGQYFRARNVDELEKIYQLLDKIEPVERDVQLYRPIEALFWWPLTAALLLSLLLALAGRR